ncbi:hypothetical protein [Bryobacter aggregatus]|uniref:hypothetical protein n=1 Tax=Bryobacter aggregatus TaxID=360054 RepID=UPI0004E14005|nr:hypothetical protein [Bryobacter aggregatus]
MSEQEIQALLSAFAAGTLTEEQRSRLMEAALSDQSLFDALMEEETMRAALESPAVREELAGLLAPAQIAADNGVTDARHREMQALAPTLTRLSPPPPQPKRRWLLIALAACLAGGIATIALWRQPSPPTEVAVAQLPRQAPVPQQTPAVIELKPEPPTSKQLAKKKEMVLPTQRENPPAAVADAQIKVHQPERRANPPAAMSDSQIAISAATPKDSFIRQSTEASAAAPVRRNDLAETRARTAAIANGKLVLEPQVFSYTYAFLIDGAETKPIPAIGLLRPERHEFEIPSHGPGAVIWVFLTPTRDSLLERAMVGVRPLPTRDWIKLPIP